MTTELSVVPKTVNSDVGVIVGRFQVPELHHAHRELFDYVIGRHRKVLVFLGTSSVLCSRRNPLDFIARQQMVNKAYPNVVVLPIADCKSDKVWSNILDAQIRSMVPTNSVKIYGSRDSFLAHYHGDYDVEELVQTHFVSGTAIRKDVSIEVQESPLWRAGVIYGASNRYPTAYPTIDVAIVKRVSASIRTDQILLVKKPDEEKFRFTGGFVSPTDINLEQTVRRETYEETGVSVDGIKYVGSTIVNDWRYMAEDDKIMTTLFLATYQSGRVTPGDDVSEAKWFPMEELLSDYNLVEDTHVPLVKLLVSYIGS